MGPLRERIRHSLPCENTGLAQKYREVPEIYQFLNVARII